MIREIQPGQIIESKKTGCKYRIHGLDMGFVAVTRIEDSIGANVFKFPIPYIRYNYKLVDPK